MVILFAIILQMLLCNLFFYNLFSVSVRHYSSSVFKSINCDISKCPINWGLYIRLISSFPEREHMGFNGARLLNNKIKINKSKPQWTYLLCILEKVLVTQYSPFLWDSVEHSPPDLSVHRILQARLPEWVAIPFSRGSFQPRDWIRASGIAGRFFIIWASNAGDTTK